MSMEILKAAPSADEAIDKRFSLFALACVLTDDPKRAERLVRLTIAGGDMSFAGPERVQARDVAREFARRLYLSFRDDAELSGPADAVLPDAEGMPEAVRRLPELQRVVFALCAFGGHTCHQAAILLKISEELAKDHLHESLRILDAQ